MLPFSAGPIRSRLVQNALTVSTMKIIPNATKAEK